MRELLDRERAMMSHEKEQRGMSGDEGNGSAEGVGGANRRWTSARSQRFHASVVGYEVSQPELATLAQEIKTETARDATLYILDVLTAVLASGTVRGNTDQTFRSLG